jgi:hypothetical protein
MGDQSARLTVTLNAGTNGGVDQATRPETLMTSSQKS